MGVLIRIRGDGREAKINMQSMTSEDLTDQAEMWMFSNRLYGGH